VNKYKWNILSDKKIDTIDELIKVLAKNREIEDIEGFCNPPTQENFIKSDKEMKALLDKGIAKSAKTILNSIKSNSPIIIHGDYDVDGQTATTILWKTIYEDLNYKNCTPYIPNRFDQGYGLSKNSIDAIKSDVAKNAENPLIITVDCGIVATKEVEYAKSLGFKVIITDHHQTHGEIPNADALVHTTNATGAGISWILSYALDPKSSSSKIGFAALGTICDLQPLTNFNRSIVKHGLIQLNQNPPIGIKELIDISAIKGNIDTYEVGWVLGPRLNATGRMKDAMDSLRLLSTNSKEQAQNLARKLDDINKKRQGKLQTDLKLGLENIKNNAETPNFIVTSNESYHEGIIGLVAGKLTQIYYRPSIAIAIDNKKKLAKGSARSIKGISIIETLHKFDDLFEGLGGHDMAAGFSLIPAKIPQLIKSLNSIKILDKSVFDQSLHIDAELSSSLISFDILDTINNFKPFGIDNYEPVFMSKSLEIFNMIRFGKENAHLKLFLQNSEGQQFTCLYFGAGLNTESLEIGSKINIAYNLSINNWNGNSNLELKIKDIST